MKVLITGGHTQIPIDQVRVISNIFKGKTACNIADYFSDRCIVNLLGNPDMSPYPIVNKYIKYKSYDELYRLMEDQIKHGAYDVIIHSAAVSDYYVSGVVTEPGGSYIDSSKKVSSSHDTLYLELKKTRKIVDDIRSLWGFTGCLVKFKLQVGLTDEELLDIARKSRTDSGANIIVANCLEWSKERAFIVTDKDEYSVQRKDLPKALYAEISK
jgi:phosphopantothenoylcysteine synthetase/decarboxylase